jgi:hypothetical protein
MGDFSAVRRFVVIRFRAPSGETLPCPADNLSEALRRQRRCSFRQAHIRKTQMGKRVDVRLFHRLLAAILRTPIYY